LATLLAELFRDPGCFSEARSAESVIPTRFAPQAAPVAGAVGSPWAA